MHYAGKRSESRIRRIALISRILVTFILPCHDPDHGEAISIKFYPSKLLKHPLRHEPLNIVHYRCIHHRNWRN